MEKSPNIVWFKRQYLLHFKVDRSNYCWQYNPASSIEQEMEITDEKKSLEKIHCFDNKFRAITGFCFMAG